MPTNCIFSLTIHFLELILWKWSKNNMPQVQPFKESLEAIIKKNKRNNSHIRIIIIQLLISYNLKLFPVFKMPDFFRLQESPLLSLLSKSHNLHIFEKKNLRNPLRSKYKMPVDVLTWQWLSMYQKKIFYGKSYFEFYVGYIKTTVTVLYSSFCICFHLYFFLLVNAYLGN